MSRLAQSRENVAYDLSLFEPKEAREAAEAAVREEKAAAPQSTAAPAARPRAAVRPLTVLRWAAVSLFAMTALLAVMVGNVQLNRLNNQEAQLKSQLSNAKSAQVQLNVQLESRTSLDNVENYAVNKLGLQKIGPYQIEYVHLLNTDKVELGSDSGNIFARLCGGVLEYLQRLANSI